MLFTSRSQSSRESTSKATIKSLEVQRKTFYGEKGDDIIYGGGGKEILLLAVQEGIRCGVKVDEIPSASSEVTVTPSSKISLTAKIAFILAQAVAA